MRRYTDEEERAFEAKILKLKAEGLKMVTIAQRLGLHPDTITLRLNRWRKRQQEENRA